MDFVTKVSFSLLNAGVPALALILLNAPGWAVFAFFALMYNITLLGMTK